MDWAYQKEWRAADGSSASGVPGRLEPSRKLSLDTMLLTSSLRRCEGSSGESPGTEIFQGISPSSTTRNGS